MAKNKQSKKRKKPMTKSPNTPDFEVKQSIPKTIFGSGGNSSGIHSNTSSMRSPGSQRKR